MLPIPTVLISLNDTAAVNRMGSHSLISSAGEHLVSGGNLIRRRPARFSVGALLFLLCLYLLPPQIWQIFFGYTPLDEFASALQTWISKNQDYSYTLISNQGADDFAREDYADRPDILEPFLQLK